jgi:hypothetical protein
MPLAESWWMEVGQFLNVQDEPGLAMQAAYKAGQIQMRVRAIDVVNDAREEGAELREVRSRIEHLSVEE